MANSSSFMCMARLTVMQPGSFTVEGDTLKLKSDKEPGKDFTITNQSKNGTGYTVQFTHPNKYVLKHILCIFVVDGSSRRNLPTTTGRCMLRFRIVIPSMPYIPYIPTSQLLSKMTRTTTIISHLN